jgi:hypothetical protein
MSSPAPMKSLLTSCPRKNGYELEWTAAISAAGLKRMFSRLTIKTYTLSQIFSYQYFMAKKIAKSIMKSAYAYLY